MCLCSYTFVSATVSLDSFDLLSVARQKYMVEYLSSFVERDGLCCGTCVILVMDGSVTSCAW
jgi:hypothetical protein